LAPAFTAKAAARRQHRGVASAHRGVGGNAVLLDGQAAVRREAGLGRRAPGDQDQVRVDGAAALQDDPVRAVELSNLNSRPDRHALIGQPVL
jgi:hypothetical protein